MRLSILSKLYLYIDISYTDTITYFTFYIFLVLGLRCAEQSAVRERDYCVGGGSMGEIVCL